MISCIEWIPKGVADPNPKRYELSKAERELLDNDMDDDNKKEEMMNGGDGDDNDEDGTGNSNEDESSNSEDKDEASPTATEIIAANKIDPSTLPAELRMDEYSDDEGEDKEAKQERGIGDLLIGDETVAAIGIDENGMIDEPIEEDSDNDNDYDSDDDDNLNDVPDTREYEPTDIKGLEAMNFSGYNGISGFEDDENADDDSDVEDTNLKADDALVIVAKTEEDFASLEVCVYEESTGNMFVHHDIPLPSYPLCMAHGTINNDGGAGNYVAVGSFDPGIEVWNADVLCPLEPTVMLGGEDTSAADEQWAKKLGVKNRPKSKFSKKGGTGLRTGSHTDAVMSLSWNPIHRQVIASGSADNTVKLWDITKADDASTGGVAATFTHHTDKVQSTAWHPTEGSILATGSYDQTVSILDARSPDNGAIKKVKIPADCEAIAWDPHQPHLLTAASEDGTVLCWDVRKFESGMTYWSFVAHEFGGCSDISYNQNIPGMLATCAVDKTIALWDTQNAGSSSDARPIACGSKDMSVGKLYSCSFYASSPWLLGCGGSKNQLALWNLETENAFQKRFGERVGGASSNPSNEGNEESNPETVDFEAMMAATDDATEKLKKNADTKKKKKGKSKKKAHRKR